jgi:hypothetical protein
MQQFETANLSVPRSAVDGLRGLARATGLTLRHVAEELASRDELSFLFGASSLAVRAAPRTPRHAVLELHTRRWPPGVIESGEASP